MSPYFGNKAALPWLRSETTQHHHHREMDTTMYEVVGSRSKEVLKTTQKAVLSGTLNITQTFKVDLTDD